MYVMLEHVRTMQGLNRQFLAESFGLFAGFNPVRKSSRVAKNFLRLKRVFPPLALPITVAAKSETTARAAFPRSGGVRTSK